MITRIEINGFKSFHNFAVDLSPFQAFIGPNGVGKTNLFEAIVLLANLANEGSIDEALRHGRGEISELFTVYSDGSRSHQMTFAVEMLIGRTVTEPSGRSIPVSSTRLRYELELEGKIDSGEEHVAVIHETLTPIAEANDSWVKNQIGTKIRKNWVIREKRPPYISTDEVKEQKTININQDLPGGGKETFNVGGLTHTAISASTPLKYPTAYAAKHEMSNWRFLQLNPVILRSRAVKAPATMLLPDGSNLAATIAYLTGQKAANLQNIVKDMKGFIPDLKNITTKPIEGHSGEFLLEVEMQDGSRFSSGVLSDGTLRLLALVTLKYDTRHQGAVCFEEPENGVQPHRLKQIVDVLFALATDFDKQEAERGLRQVLINTHSPGILAHVPNDSLFYVGSKMHEKGRETHIIPVRAVLFGDSEEQYYTWEQVRQYLDTDSLNKKREELGL